MHTYVSLGLNVSVMFMHLLIHGAFQNKWVYLCVYVYVYVCVHMGICLRRQVGIHEK